MEQTNKQTEKKEYPALSDPIKAKSIIQERKSIMPRANFTEFSFLQNKMMDDKERTEWSTENRNCLTHWLTYKNLKSIWEDKR